MKPKTFEEWYEIIQKATLSPEEFKKKQRIDELGKGGRMITEEMKEEFKLKKCRELNIAYRLPDYKKEKVR